LLRADLVTRAVAGFIDLLLILGLARLPDILGFLGAVGYILIRDGLFERRSIGKKLVGLRINSLESSKISVTYRESIIRNVTFAVAYLLFMIPYAGWLLGPLVAGVEGLVALGDEQGKRVGDLLARTVVVQEGKNEVLAPKTPESQPTSGLNDPVSADKQNL